MAWPVSSWIRSISLCSQKCEPFGTYVLLYTKKEQTNTKHSEDLFYTQLMNDSFIKYSNKINCNITKKQCQQ